MLEGLDDLARLLERMQTEVPTQVAAALNKGLATLEKAVDRQTPVKSGSLRDSTAVLGAKVRNGQVFGAVVNKSPHAAAVEFGTSEQAADPFMRRAVDAEGARVLDEAVRDIARGIEGFH